MKEKRERNNYFYLVAIVAIVAVVGIVILTLGVRTPVATTTSESGLEAEGQGDLAGVAIDYPLSELKCIKGSVVEYAGQRKPFRCNTPTAEAIITFLINGGYTDETIFGMIHPATNNFGLIEDYANYEDGHSVFYRLRVSELENPDAFLNIQDLANAKQLTSLSIYTYDEGAPIVDGANYFSQLTALEDLKLTTGFTSPVDMNIFRGLTNLEVFWLSTQTDFSGSLDIFRNHQLLSNLVIQRTGEQFSQFRGNIDAIRNLPRLRYLNLHNIEVFGDMESFNMVNKDFQTFSVFDTDIFLTGIEPKITGYYAVNVDERYFLSDNFQTAADRLHFCMNVNNWNAIQRKCASLSIECYRTVPDTMSHCKGG